MSTETKNPMMGLRKKAEELIDPFVKNFIVELYPKMRQFRVGAIHSKGKASQYDLTGSYHRDYLQEDVIKRHANERPFLIILALDEFKFQYKNNMLGEVTKVCVPIRHAAIFSNELSHCGGANNTDDYAYRLFAYVVLDDANYPVGTIEIDRDDDNGKELGGGGGQMAEVKNILQQERKRKKDICGLV
jgi:hypothetical protein